VSIRYSSEEEQNQDIGTPIDDTKLTEKRWEGEDEALPAISKCSICQLAFFGVISREVEDDSVIQKLSLAALNANSRFDMQPELSKHPLFQSSRRVRNSVKTGTAAIGIIRGSIIPRAEHTRPASPPPLASAARFQIRYAHPISLDCHQL
jgi:hypothetical protein